MEDGDTDGDNHSDRDSNKFGNGIVHEVKTLPGPPCGGRGKTHLSPP